MSNRAEQWRRWFDLRNGIVLLLAFCLPLPVFATLAPVMGGHYAARKSDTGFTGAVNSVGAYGASVPLDLPAARGGLPIPVQVTYGGNQVGAAGLGWDVPLSTIVRSKTLAYHRPKPGTFPDPNAPSSSDPLPLPESLTLTLGGGPTDLILNAEGTAWVARNDAQLEVRANGSDKFVVYDGNGLTYQFSSQGAAAGSRLENNNLYLLRNVTGPAGTVHLEYNFGAPVLPGGGTGLSINLRSVAYNQSPTNSNCFKHKIQLNYDAPAAAPLSMSILGGTVLARTQKLASISVDSKATCASSPVSLRRYDFVYQTDPDTQRPQLQKVTMVGQQGTPERNVTMPVATYGYGTLTDSNGAITFQKTQSIGVPGAADSVFSHGLSHTTATPTNRRDITNLYTTQALVDLDGDGRPDLTTDSGVYRNLPSSSLQGQSTFVKADVSWAYDPGPERSEANSRAARYSRFQAWNEELPYASATPARVYTSTWQQYVDINADGRMDFVDASQSPDYWVVHLSAPDPGNPKNSISVVRRISVAAVRKALGNRLDTQNVPLARQVTVARQGALKCFVLTEFEGWETPTKNFCPGMDEALRTHAQAQTTVTLWELNDINGDGYPDFVFDVGSDLSNASPVPEPVMDAPLGTYVFQQGAGVDLSSQRGVEVLYNSAGVHIGFESSGPGSITFEERAALASECGVGRWEPLPGDKDGILYQTCGFVDVNGDGITDRVTSELVPTADFGWHSFLSKAALGTGNPGQPFAATKIVLPGPLSSVHTDMVSSTGGPVPAACNAAPDGSYDTVRGQSLRDINGDGLPDYISEYSGGARQWSVSFGTGTGFTQLRPLNVPAGLELSRELSSCPDGDGISGTDAGLYDLDGDGQPELVDMNFSAKTLDVYQLKSPITQFEIGGFAGVPQAGRLIKIDNGYGASTRLSYQSAKVDPSTPHNVPNPEIVVGAERTTDSLSVGVNRAATILHAYGNVQQVFDSVQDRFVFPGYGRAVTMVGTQAGSPPKGLITITDTYGLSPFVVGSDATARFKRYMTTGKVSDVTTLSGDIAGVDPWQFLTVNIANDPRRISGTHYDWDARLLASGQPTGQNEPCVEMADPYDYTKSLENALSPNDECTRRGFVFQKQVYSWRGAPGTADPHIISSTVQTSSSVEAVDDFGRVTQVRDDNDRAINNDDLCTQSTYATPASAAARPRVLNALATRTLTNCANPPVPLAKSSWEYDMMAVGQVTNGFVTSHIQSRLGENGQPILDATGQHEIRLFDATYDSIGTLQTLTKARDDGATRTETFAYDPFNLALTTAVIDASGGIPRLTVNIERDPLTLNALNTGDPNGTRRGNIFDGFNRVRLSIVTPPGGTTGVLAAMSYAGFGVGETGGRRVEQKVFTDPVEAGNVATAPGRIGTTYFDQLGRPTRTDVQLGADYGNKVMVIGQRSYDLLGRVKFEADPHPSDETIPYGTSWHFNVDGKPLCAIRGRGEQALTKTTDEVKERYPTCFNYEYLANKSFLEILDASSNLPGSAQEGIRRMLISDATGHLLSDWTLKDQVIKNLKFGYDALGRRTSLTRYLDPSMSGDPVTTRWHYDSFGQVIELDEPHSAPQVRSYDTWNQLTQVQWTDATSGSRIDKRSVNRYDGLGRLVHSEDQNNQVTIPETVKDFVYDQDFSIASPPVWATNVIGRLSKATAKTSSVFFSYDDFGRVDTQVFSDSTVTPARVYVQKNQWHGDGSPQALQLTLPDHNFAAERVEYSYDSAARLRAVTYSDGTTQDLFTANGAGDIDVFGRIRQAQFGPATFNAVFAETGRRLIKDLKVTTPTQDSRRISFAPVPATPASVTSFDPAGRERARQEFVNDVANPVKLVNYDNLGRFSLSSSRPFIASMIEHTAAYNPLGNLSSKADAMAPENSVALSYQSTDPDRICSIGYGESAAPAACNVSYDAAGNMVSQPTRNDGTRKFSYFPGGQIRQIIQNGSVATYDYDAFGAVQRLAVGGTTPNDIRHDKYFGGLIAQRNEVGAPVVTRTIPLPGAIATRHGPTGKWTFAFAEQRGTRFVTDERGEFVQGVDYQPFGEVKDATGASPGSTEYTREQWNGGDLLATFGINRLGARLYDPVIGRFLSRDPLFDAGNDFNPYAFAANDPINNADPTGTQVSTGPKPCSLCSMFTHLQGSQFMASGYEATSGYGGGSGGSGRTTFVEGHWEGKEVIDPQFPDAFAWQDTWVSERIFTYLPVDPLIPLSERYTSTDRLNELKRYGKIADTTSKAVQAFQTPVVTRTFHTVRRVGTGAGIASTAINTVSLLADPTLGNALDLGEDILDGALISYPVFGWSAYGIKELLKVGIEFGLSPEGAEIMRRQQEVQLRFHMGRPGLGG